MAFWSSRNRFGVPAKVTSGRSVGSTAAPEGEPVVTCGSGASGSEVELSAETLLDETGCIEAVCA